MGNGPNQTNSSATILNAVIAAFFAGGEKAAEAAIIALDPVLLGSPFGVWLVDHGVAYLGQILSVAGQKFADSIVIDIQTQGEASAVRVAGTALALANASGGNDDIAKATQQLTNAYKSLIQWDGIAAPH